VNKMKWQDRRAKHRMVISLATFLGTTGFLSIAGAAAAPRPEAVPPRAPAPDAVQRNPAAGGSFDEQHRQARLKSPRDVTLTAVITDGSIEFRPGQGIGLELNFGTSLPASYTLDHTVERTGRVMRDTFYITPQDGVMDPLQAYFQSGLSDDNTTPPNPARALSLLAAKPDHVTLDLNEWLRFARPGWYRLYVTSDRVVNERLAGRYGDTGKRPVTSNIVEFEVLPPDPRWANQQLRKAVRILEKNKNVESKSTVAAPPVVAPKTSVPQPPTVDPKGNVTDPKLAVIVPTLKVVDPQKELQDRREASRTLRFLGTEEATKEMVRLFDGSDPESDAQYHLGLVGAPDRALALQEMEKRLDAPDQPVSQGFIHTLAALSFLAQQPAPMPAGEAGRAEKQKRQEAYLGFVKEYEERLATAVAGKEGPARAHSLYTLLEWALSQVGPERTPQQTAWLTKLSDGLIAGFDQLPLHVQSTLLESRWPLLARPAVLPVLRRIYAAPEDDADATEANAGASANGAAKTTQEQADQEEQPADDPDERRLRGLALRRLLELDPKEGSWRIRQEMRSPRPRVGLEVLGALSDATLPDLEKILITNLEKSRSDADDALYSGLVARYATERVLPRVRKLYTDWQEWTCPAQAALLAYFLRVEPRTGTALVREALAERNAMECHRSLLGEVAKWGVQSALEPVAVAQLNAPDAGAASDAATVLGRYSSAPETKSLLWGRLKTWNKHWKGRESELRLLRAGSNGVPMAADLQLALVRALVHAPGWLVDKPQLQQIQSLLLTSDARREMDAVMREWNDKIRITYKPGVTEQWHVAQYQSDSLAALQTKLAQFPKGTTFLWDDASGAPDARVEPVYTRVKALVEKQGMKITVPSLTAARDRDRTAILWRGSSLD